jgi:hypothetical protein
MADVHPSLVMTSGFPRLSLPAGAVARTVAWGDMVLAVALVLPGLVRWMVALPLAQPRLQLIGASDISFWVCRTTCASILCVCVMSQRIILWVFADGVHWVPWGEFSSLFASSSV